MVTTFSDALHKVRKDAGFPTAYRFFHANGGAQALGFTYRQYLRMEQGKSLPESNKLAKLVLALRLATRSAAADELAIAWLKTLVGDETYRLIFQFIPAAGPASDVAPAQHALKRALVDKKYFVNHKQFSAIIADQDTFLCFLAMTMDAGAWSVEQVAKALEIPAADAEKALKRLSSVKLLKPVKKGMYKCPIARRQKEFPHMRTLPPELRGKFGEHMRALVKKGKTWWTRGGVVRADTDAFKNFLPVMKQNLSLADAYCTTEKTPKSALYFVEGRIVKLRDF